MLDAEAAVLLAGVPEPAYGVQRTVLGSGAHAAPTSSCSSRARSSAAGVGSLDGLLEEVVDPRQQGERAVGVGVAAGDVRADLDELA